MKGLLTFIVALALGCTNKDTVVESTTDSTYKKFSDLNDSEKIGLLAQIGEEFKGDYRKYLGQNEDSTLVQLALNTDKRFAICFKAFFNDKTKTDDSIITFQVSATSEFKNLCIGRWTDEGQKIRLKIVLGQSDFFDSLKNVGIAELIDDKTVLLDKDAKEVWISKALCKMN